MKKLLLFIFFLPYTLFAQTKKVDGFWGIKFGTEKALALKTMTTKGAIIDVKNSTDEAKIFDNVTFAERKAYFLMLKFTGNKFYNSIIAFKPDEDDIIKEFNDMVKELSDIYGKGDVYKNFKSPYEDGDGYETLAIKSGKADYSAYWSSVNSEGNKNYISLSISKEMFIRLDYQDGTIIKNVVAAKEQEKAKDY